MKGRDGLTVTEHPHPVDVHVGTRVRLGRTVRGMSQENLSSAIGLTFQQVQKYERGTNRISASQLYELSRVLAVPVAFFFEGFDAKEHASMQVAEMDEPPVANYRGNREVLEIARSFQRISNAALRQHLFDLFKAVTSTFQK